MGVKVWSKVAIAVQSALAAALTVSGITKANPAVVTYTGTDPTNGDYILMKVQGMYQLDYKVVRAANVNAGSNTFECEGVDSTSYDTFSSGTAEVITFGTTLAIISDVSASGGDPEFIDVTTIHDDINKQIPGNFSAIVYNMTANWDPADAGLIALKAASDLKAVRCVRITFSDNTRVAFAGYVAASGVPTGSAKAKVATPIAITAYGRPSMFAT